MTATHQGEEAQDDRTAPRVRDDVLRLGPDGQLVGILSRPITERARTPGPAPALVILNAGVLHRVGPHRLHVSLARQIASRGLPALRLDLGGIGDSVAATDAATFRESAVADTRLALTGLGEATGATRFVVFGVCSGADNAIATALVDDRVAGIVLVDPPTYPTRRGQLRDLRARVAQRGGPREVLAWAIKAAERRARIAIARLNRASTGDDPPSEGRELPPVATFRTQLTTILDRGAKIYSIYAGIHGARYNHPDQLFELFPELRGRLDHAYFPAANHTFTELAAQAALLDAVTAWITKHYG